ncbi:hypothetical protein DB88DRAFT_444466, partial [Papiliotrema laurentii]
AIQAGANKAFAAGDYNQAIELYSEAIALNSSSHVLHSNRSVSLARRQDYFGALRDVESVCGRDLGRGSDRSECTDHRARLEFRQGTCAQKCPLLGLCRYHDAFRAYEAGLEVDPTSDVCREGLAKVENAIEVNGFSTNRDLSAELEANRETRDYLRDPAFAQMIRQLQRFQGIPRAWLEDPRMENVLSVAIEGGVLSHGAD